VDLCSVCPSILDSQKFITWSLGNLVLIFIVKEDLGAIKDYLHK
jgi:hypothetical protein